jgi:hypothetical protein
MLRIGYANDGDAQHRPEVEAGVVETSEARSQVLQARLPLWRPPTRPAQMKNLGLTDAKHRRPFEERRPEAAFAPSPPQAGGGKQRRGNRSFHRRQAGLWHPAMPSGHRGVVRLINR